ncbi:MlaD family protein [Paraconexibacter antarcticus]|uniref:MlaD family protein n=1 Tax=Paraconexibacter antarcticus TaxID=2949664 RepID=A0ABY5DNL5_9ACTN|nr:MlaD family protein [Paraconexibacter antarcticus]UTI63251.1 MlaD family protein [Paraconexibacter antarcticus]
MNKQPPTLGRIMIMVTFALSCFGLLLFLWISFGGAVPLQPKGYRVKISVAEATQLATQADVRISGVPIGKVVTLERDGDRTLATLQIKPKYVPLPDDVRVILRQKTLLGETYVEMTPGTRTAPRLAENATLPAKQAQNTVELDEVLQSLDAPSRKNLQSWLNGWAASMDGRAENINDILGTLPATVDDAGDLLGILAQQRRALRQLISGAGTVFATVGDRDRATRQIITAGDTVLRTTAARQGDLRATVRALPPFLAALRGAARPAAQLSQTLTPSLRTLRPVARTLKPTVQGAARLGTQLSLTARRLDPVITTAKQGLPATRQVLAAAGPALDRVSPLAGDLVPIAQFLDAYKKDFTRSWAYVANATAPTAASGGGRQVHYLRLILPVWNEIVAEYAKRGPTNRANPYPAPGGLARLGQGKPLQTLGCGHLNNPQLVPVIGPGPPVCDPQPAFSIGGGHSSEFPNLQRAAP